MSDPLIFHAKFTRRDFDAQHRLAPVRPGFEATVMSGWIEDSKTALKVLDCPSDMPVRPGENQKSDVFFMWRRKRASTGRRPRCAIL